ncbi:MAG: T9SS type A sorting domain-containing protein [Candidatus Cloacimonetes bacterium]|nr:T9SS type A sorting domain-containing protein [Candidatus Cloacimonadota bacterium]MCF7814562.1 T9SS type A sorting domain-containing protein [Candidatus Cloacimonadota bacterium]MCF7867772.1 T9SS type A sorting domain-containing protein [Candidatus Cloacimonadota bacterium]MCF7883250.1 T9SS type A sorting domain-containing protein [Candidatus Cloacimonadota bacterium]
MKKIYFSIILIIYSLLSSQETELTKMNDFNIAQTYGQMDNAIVDSGILYAISDYGLEIYQIGNNGDLTLLSQTPIPLGNSFTKKDDYVYVSASPMSYQFQSGNVYQIDVSDSVNPTIVQEIDFEYDTWPIKIYGNYLNVCCYDYANNSYHNYFYSLPDLVFVSHFQNLLNYSDKIGDTITARFDGYNQFTIFDLSDPTLPEIVGNGNISSYHQYNAQRIKAYNDTVYIASNSAEITLWDISDLNNWEYISQYDPDVDIFNDFSPLICDNYVFLAEFGYIEVIDVSDISNPVRLDYLSGTDANSILTTLINSNENLYLMTAFNGIQHITFIDDELRFEGNYANYYYSNRYKQIDNYLLAGSITHYIKGYDVSNPLNFVDLGELFTDYWSIFELSNNKLAMLKNDDYSYYVYDISDINSPIQTNQISCDFYNECCFDETDEESFYVLDLNNNLLKYNVSEPGTSSLLFTLDLPFTIEDWIIHDGYGYFLENISTFNQKIYVYQNLDSNQPVLFNSINNFVSNPNAEMKVKNDKLVIYNEFSYDYSPSISTKIFNLNNPTNPELNLELQAFGEPFLTDELIFVASGDECCVFENLGNSPEILEPISVFTDLSEINYIALNDFNNQKYVTLCQGSHNGVFSYEYTSSSCENEILLNNFKLSNYPNPFNPSTTISFNVLPSYDSASIEIYNIKGQKVKTFCHAELVEACGTINNYSVVWNGDDDNGKPVSSGVYLYQLKTDEKALTQKKCMLLK